MFFVWQPTTAQFTISAELRPRTEFREGYRRMPEKDEKAAAFVYQRSRLNLEYSQERVTTYLSLQDIRVWGQDPQKIHNPSFDVHQAWIEFQVNEEFALKAGRQELRYDNQRFLAINNWIMPGQKHDLLLAKYNSEAGQIHLGTAFNQSADHINQNMANFGTTYPVNNYKYMNFAWYHTPLSEAGKISLLAMAEGNENTANGTLYVRGTWSAYSQWEFRNLSLIVNPAFQHGKTRQGQDVAAHYLRAELGLNPSGNLKTIAGIEYFSGNDFTNEDDTRYRVFDPTQGAGHDHNGYMDYFTNFPAHTRGAGLINPFLKNRININTLTYLDVDFHGFLLANNYVHNQQVIDSFLGTELDLTLGYRFNSFTQIMMGYSFMFGTESMEIIRGGSKDRWAQWAFLMVTIRPVFFKS